MGGDDGGVAGRDNYCQQGFWAEQNPGRDGEGRCHGGMTMSWSPKSSRREGRSQGTRGKRLRIWGGKLISIVWDAGLQDYRLPGHCKGSVTPLGRGLVCLGLHKPVWTTASQGKAGTRSVGPLSCFFSFCHSYPPSSAVHPSPGPGRLIGTDHMPRCLSG